MQIKKKWVTMYLDLCDRISEESHAVRLKVGAVFVSPDGVISIGINGMPSGGSNVCENSMDETEFISGTINPYKIVKRLITKPECSHAEENLYQKLMLQGVSTKEGSIFISHSPCIQCAKIIVGSGVKLVVYRNEYRDSSGIDWIKFNNIDCYKESEYGII